MRMATCCERGSKDIEYVIFGVGDAGWGMPNRMYGHDWLGGPVKQKQWYYRVNCCPFCGCDPNGPQTLEQALRLLAESEEKVTICFDVDGVLCDDRDGSIPYDERQPYSWVAEVLGILKANGHTVHVQTARYMEKFDGDQIKAITHGIYELTQWLRFHKIPYDKAYLGKASAHIYADDRGCQIISNRGSTDWSKVLLPRIAAIQAKRSRVSANVRV